MPACWAQWPCVSRLFLRGEGKKLGKNTPGRSLGIVVQGTNQPGSGSCRTSSRGETIVFCGPRHNLGRLRSSQLPADHAHPKGEPAERLEAPIEQKPNPARRAKIVAVDQVHTCSREPSSFKVPTIHPRVR